MKLMVDIGNTRIKWALHDGDQAVVFGKFMQRDYVNGFEQVPEDSLQAIYYASVTSPEKEQVLVEYFEKRWGAVAIKLHTSDVCCGVSNGYQQPGQLGVDRWAAIIAARQMFQEPVCVVDCGSAVTVDAIDEGGCHLGGYIIPGLSMQQQLLRHGTAAVDVDDVIVSQSGWGNTTNSCVTHGCAEAVAGLIERSHRQLEHQYGKSVVTVVTGGDAAVILPLLEHQVQHEEHLVLMGMAYMSRTLEG